MRQVATATELQVIPAEGNALHWGLTFAPDGNYLYYLKHVAGEPEPALYRVSTLGGASRKVSDRVSSCVGASPDGTRITFVRRLLESHESALIIANADGTEERQLAVRQLPQSSFSDGPRAGPSWSPDGQTIGPNLDQKSY